MKRKYQKYVTHNTRINKAIETYFDMVHILDIIDNDLNSAMLLCLQATKE